MSQPFRFAVVSHTLPPASNGQAIALWRILRGLDIAQYCLILSGTESPSSGGPAGAESLHAPRFVLPGYRSSFLRAGPLRRVLTLLALPVRLVIRLVALCRILRQQRCEGVVVCTGEILDLPLGYLAARLLGIGFYPYLFDWYAHQFDVATGWIGGGIKRGAAWLERPLLRRADHVIVPNEFLLREIWDLYGVRGCLVRNPTDLEQDTNGVRREPPALSSSCANRDKGVRDKGVLDKGVCDEGVQDKREGDARRMCRILYTGAVYEAHFDAFRNLVQAIAEGAAESVRLVVYTDQPVEYLARQGICGPVEFRPRVPADQVQRLQREADLLFLPLAFQSPYPELIRTSAPGKLGDYLASGRPILAHVPGDSYVAWYLRQHEAGLVVDACSPQALGPVLKQLVQDAALRDRLSRNAGICARRDFSAEKSQTDFLDALQPHWQTSAPHVMVKDPAPVKRQLAVVDGSALAEEHGMENGPVVAMVVAESGPRRSQVDSEASELPLSRKSA